MFFLVFRYPNCLPARRDSHTILPPHPSFLRNKKVICDVDEIKLNFKINEEKEKKTYEDDAKTN